MPATNPDQVKFLMRANRGQQQSLDRLRKHTGISTRTLAVWHAVENLPRLEEDLRRLRPELDRLRRVIADAARAAETAELAVECRDRALALLREEAASSPVNGGLRVGHEHARDPLVHLDQ